MRMGAVTGLSALSRALTAAGATKTSAQTGGPAAAFGAILAAAGTDQGYKGTPRILMESVSGTLAAPAPASTRAAGTIVPELPVVPAAAAGLVGIVDSMATGSPINNSQPVTALLFGGGAMPASAVASKPGVKPVGTKATPQVGEEEVAAGASDPALAFPPQLGQAIGGVAASPDITSSVPTPAAASPDVTSSIPTPAVPSPDVGSDLPTTVAAIPGPAALSGAPPGPVLPAVVQSGPWATAPGPGATGSPAGPFPAPGTPIVASSPAASPAGAAPGINGAPGIDAAAAVGPMVPGMASLATTIPKVPAARSAATPQVTLQPAHPGAPRASNTAAAAMDLQKLDPAIPVIGVSSRPAPGPVISVTGAGGAAPGHGVTAPLTDAFPGPGIPTETGPAVANPVGTAPEIIGGQGVAAPGTTVPDALLQTAVAAPATVVLPGQAPGSLRTRNAPSASAALTADAPAPVADNGIAQMQGGIAAPEISSTNVGKLAAPQPPSAPPGLPASVLDQVAPAVVAAAKVGDIGHRVSVSLNPDQLGTVTVTVDRNADGTMHIQVSAAQMATLDMLRRDQGELVRALDQAGTGQGSPGLSFSLDSGSGGGWSMPGGQQDARPPVHFPSAYADETAQATTWPGASRRAASGSIDVTA